MAVRVAGGCYLIYLGLRLIAARAQPVEIDAADVAPVKAHRSFLFGLGVTLTNPKAVVLFASVFAPAISAQTPIWVMATMVVLVMTSSAVWYTLVTLFMTAPPMLRRFRGLQHWIERVAGVCFVAIGGRILADARSPGAA